MNEKIPVKLNWVLLFGLAGLFFGFFSCNALAKNDSTQVVANIDSPVSKIYSEVSLSSDVVVAEPLTQPILITVCLRDVKSNPVVNRDVFVTSERGAVDVIEATSRLSKYMVNAADDLMNHDKTDDNGRASFRLTSFYPGEAKIKIIADNIVELPSQQVEFRSRPIPAYFEVDLKLPFSKRTLTLIPSGYREDQLTPTQKESIKSINLATKVTLPLWLFIIILIVFFGIPVFWIINIVNLRKIKAVEAAERVLLKEISQSSKI